MIVGFVLPCSSDILFPRLLREVLSNVRSSGDYTYTNANILDRPSKIIVTDGAGDLPPFSAHGIIRRFGLAWFLTYPSPELWESGKRVLQRFPTLPFFGKRLFHSSLVLAPQTLFMPWSHGAQAFAENPPRTNNARRSKIVAANFYPKEFPRTPMADKATVPHTNIHSVLQEQRKFECPEEFRR